MIRIGLFLAFAAHAVTATPTFRRDDHWAPHPTGWDEAPEGNTWMAMAPPSHMMEMRIGVMSNNMEGLEKAVYEMSTPGNPKYGMHLSTDEVCCVIHLYPLSACLSISTGQSVYGSKHGKYECSNKLDYQHGSHVYYLFHGRMGTSYRTCFDCKRNASNQLLNVYGMFNTGVTLVTLLIYIFQHEASGQTMMRTLNYSLPADVAGHVKAVYPTTSCVECSFRLSHT